LPNAPSLATSPTGVAAARDDVSAIADLRPFARCEVLDDLSRAQAPWAQLQPFVRASPYQNFGFVDAWMQTIGRARGITPMIVVARDESGRVNAILPLGRVRRGPVWSAEFIGDRDANFKMGLFRAGIQATPAAIVDLLRRSARMTRPSVDVFWLTNQPHSWQGGANPMAELPSRPSPSFGYKSAIGRDFELWLTNHFSKDARKKLRQKARRLNEMGALSPIVAHDEEGARSILAAFSRQKEARMRASGVRNPYASPEASRFLDIAATNNLAELTQEIELHALMSGDRIVATFGGLAHGGRFCGMFISYDTDPEISRYSPGQLLILETVRDIMARGFVTFDLGVGEARYKDASCEADEPLFDTAVSITPIGFAFATAALTQRRVKRWIKHKPAVLALVDRMRRRPPP
jgi:CelD/BcsL family acetyltransferase involved in cellulose biosynthesis